MTPPFRYQTVTKARQKKPKEWGSLRPSFLLRLAQQIPNNLRKGRKMMKFEITKENVISGGTTTETKEFETLKEFWKYTSKNYITNIKTLEEETEEEAFDYEGTISFTTNQKLTQDQLNQLMDIITLQIVEPVDADQEDEDYSTRNAEVTVKEVK